MSTNEELGDSVTHFFKTGGVLRNKDETLLPLKNLLPANGPMGTRVEYDVWYDMADKNRIHGYVYTDAMGKFLYLRVGDADRAYAAMEKAANSDFTAEGWHILNDLASTSSDKYKLKKTTKTYDRVVFLAGANILDKAVDWSKLDYLVAKGWKLKCHPLTSRDLNQLLVKRFGQSAIIDKKISGYSLLETASAVACAENSEMGIVAVAKGKELVGVGCGNKQLTYSAIYAQLNLSEDKRITLAKILSCKSSGLIPVVAQDAEERVQLFFNQYKELPHVEPKSNNT